jgi:hypothetical protein
MITGYIDTLKTNREKKTKVIIFISQVNKERKLRLLCTITYSIYTTNKCTCHVHYALHDVMRMI